MACCFIYTIHLLYAADGVPVKPLIHEAVFTLVTTGNMSVYQHALERRRENGEKSAAFHGSIQHTHTVGFVFWWQ